MAAERRGTRAGRNSSPYLERGRVFLNAHLSGMLFMSLAISQDPDSSGCFVVGVEGAGPDTPSGPRAASFRTGQSPFPGRGIVVCVLPRGETAAGTADVPWRKGSPGADAQAAACERPGRGHRLSPHSALGQPGRWCRARRARKRGEAGLCPVLVFWVRDSALEAAVESSPQQAVSLPRPQPPPL